MRVSPIIREKEYKEFLEGLASYLEHYILVTGHTQASLAERVGLSQSGLSAILQRRRGAVMTSTLWNILAAAR